MGYTCIQFQQLCSAAHSWTIFMDLSAVALLAPHLGLGVGSCAGFVQYCFWLFTSCHAASTWGTACYISCHFICSVPFIGCAVELASLPSVALAVWHVHVICVHIHLAKQWAQVPGKHCECASAGVVLPLCTLSLPFLPHVLRPSFHLSLLFYLLILQDVVSANLSPISPCSSSHSIISPSPSRIHSPPPSPPRCDWFPSSSTSFRSGLVRVGFLMLGKELSALSLSCALCTLLTCFSASCRGVWKR